MSGITWWRSHHGESKLRKWNAISRHLGLGPGGAAIVKAIVWDLKNHMSQAKERGDSRDFDVEDCAEGNEVPAATVTAVIDELIRRGEIVDGRWRDWANEQPARERPNDDPAGRMRELREGRRGARELPLGAPAAIAEPLEMGRPNGAGREGAQVANAVNEALAAVAAVAADAGGTGEAATPCNADVRLCWPSSPVFADVRHCSPLFANVRQRSPLEEEEEREESTPLLSTASASADTRDACRGEGARGAELEVDPTVTPPEAAPAGVAATEPAATGLEAQVRAIWPLAPTHGFAAMRAGLDAGAIDADVLAAAGDAAAARRAPRTWPAFAGWVRSETEDRTRASNRTVSAARRSAGAPRDRAAGYAPPRPQSRLAMARDMLREEFGQEALHG